MEKLKLAARTAMLQAGAPYVPATSPASAGFHAGLSVSPGSISLPSHSLQLSSLPAAAAAASLSTQHHQHQSYLSQLARYPVFQPPSELLTVFPY